MLPARPNIIWIYCDELRTDALGCYGNKYAQMHTPNIDQLASRGQLFVNSFCNSPLCVPSRVAVLTGLYPEDTGVYANEGGWKDYRIGREDLTTIPQVFAQSDYKTVDFGKQHICPDMNPWQERNSEGSYAQPLKELLHNKGHGRISIPGLPSTASPIGGLIPADAPFPPQKLTDNALSWLQKDDGSKPYLMRMSYLQPHTPVCPPAPFNTLYDPTTFPDSFELRENVSAFEKRFANVVRGRDLSAKDVSKAQSYYYGLVAWVDSQIGRLVNYLQQSGQLDNTIILLTADHGVSLGEGGCYSKHIFAPQAHRVPLIICAPAQKSGGVRTDLADSLDIARTLFGLTGIDAPQQFKGRNLFNSSAPKEIYSTIGYGQKSSKAFPNNNTGKLEDGKGWPRRSCVRTERYRYDRNVRINGAKAAKEDMDIFLCDVQADPQETTNLAGNPEYAKVQQYLENQLLRHIENSNESSEDI